MPNIVTFFLNGGKDAWKEHKLWCHVLKYILCVYVYGWSEAFGLSDDSVSNDGESEQEESDVEDSGDEDGKSEEEQNGDAAENPNTGWAEAMAKILGKKTPDSKPIILQKNKELDKIKEKEKKERLEKKKRVLHQLSFSRSHRIQYNFKQLLLLCYKVFKCLILSF